MSSNSLLVKLDKAGLKQNNKWLVKGVSLQVEKGKIVTLIGPNGSGKSTTAKIALGIYKNIDGNVEKYTNKVGYVPQKISIDWTQINSWIDPDQYKYDRQAEYPSIVDQLDDIYHNGIDGWKTTIKAVKDKYPKG